MSRCRISTPPLLSSRTCTPEEGRRGTLRQIAITMQLVGLHRRVRSGCPIYVRGSACRFALNEVRLEAQTRTVTKLAAKKPHRKVPLSSACGERVRDDL